MLYSVFVRLVTLADTFQIGGDARPRRTNSLNYKLGVSWLKTALVTAAWAAVRTKGSYLQAQFLRLKARRGALRLPK